MDESIEASFAAASEPPVVATEADLPSQEDTPAAGLAVQDLLQADFWAWTPTAITEKRKREKRTFFIVYSFFKLFILI